MRTFNNNRVKISPFVLFVALLGGCALVQQPKLGHFGETNQDIAPMVYYCPNEDTIVFNQTGGSIFEAYRRHKKVGEHGDRIPEPRVEFEVTQCGSENFVCAEFRRPTSNTVLFTMAAPIFAARGVYSLGDLTVYVDEIDGVYGQNRRYLVIWQTVDGVRQSVSAVIEGGKGVVYFRAFNFSDMKDVENGEVCVLQTDQGLLAESMIPEARERASDLP